MLAIKTDITSYRLELPQKNNIICFSLIKAPNSVRGFYVLDFENLILALVHEGE